MVPDGFEPSGPVRSVFGPVYVYGEVGETAWSRNRSTARNRSASKAIFHRRPELVDAGGVG
jgi:hypothetical protein